MRFYGHTINWTDPFPHALTHEQRTYLWDIAVDLCRHRRARMWPTEFADNILAIRGAGRDEIFNGQVTLSSTTDESYPRQRRTVFDHKTPLYYRTKVRNKVYLSPEFYDICKGMLERKLAIPTDEEFCATFGYTVSQLSELEESNRKVLEVDMKWKKLFKKPRKA